MRYSERACRYGAAAAIRYGFIEVSRSTFSLPLSSAYSPMMPLHAEHACCHAIAFAAATLLICHADFFFFDSIAA